MMAEGSARFLSHVSHPGVGCVRRSIALGCALAILCVLTSCTAMNSEHLHIRIHNATDTDITAFWLGAGSGAGGPGSRAYGAIARGRTTPYRRLKAQFGAYSNYNFIAADGTRSVGSTVAYDLVGKMELEPGYYTFVYTVVDSKAVVTIVQDEAP
jgi:hypothetical protein